MGITWQRSALSSALYERSSLSWGSPFWDNLPTEARLPTGSVLKDVLHNVTSHPKGRKAIQNLFFQGELKSRGGKMSKAFETCVIQMANISIDGFFFFNVGRGDGLFGIFGFCFIHLFKMPEAFKALVHFFAPKVGQVRSRNWQSFKTWIAPGLA